MKGTVYVLKEPYRIKSRIVPQSGIVGSGEPGIRGNLESDEIVYFEGNLYGAVNLGRYVEKVYQAWGRMTKRYPTIALQAVPRSELIEVGEFDPAERRILVTNRAELAAWLGYGEDDIPEPELVL